MEFRFRGYNVKPSISTRSKPRTTPYTRLLKCFVLITLCCKTEHLRSLILGIVQGYEWIEILGFSLNLSIRWMGFKNILWIDKAPCIEIWVFKVNFIHQKYFFFVWKYFLIHFLVDEPILLYTLLSKIMLNFCRLHSRLFLQNVVIFLKLIIFFDKIKLIL